MLHKSMKLIFNSSLGRLISYLPLILKGINFNGLILTAI